VDLRVKGESINLTTNVTKITAKPTSPKVILLTIKIRRL
jgi:hypothetical protein